MTVNTGLLKFHRIAYRLLFCARLCFVFLVRRKRRRTASVAKLGSKKPPPMFFSSRQGHEQQLQQQLRLQPQAGATTTTTTTTMSSNDNRFNHKQKQHEQRQQPWARAKLSQLRIIFKLGQEEERRIKTFGCNSSSCFAQRSFSSLWLLFKEATATSRIDF